MTPPKKVSDKEIHPILLLIKVPRPPPPAPARPPPREMPPAPAPQRGQQALRVEDGFQGMELFEFRLAELDTHLIDFLEPHAMLTRNRTANPNAQLQNLGTQRLRAVTHIDISNNDISNNLQRLEHQFANQHVFSTLAQLFNHMH